MKALLIRFLTVAVLLSALRLSAAGAAEPSSPSALELEQAFAILDKMLPPKESFDMKDAPPNGRVINSDGGGYIFNPKLYLPSLKGADFSQDFIARLAKNHPRVMTAATMKSLPREGPYHRVLDGRSYLPCVYAIDSIRQTSPTSAEAIVTTGGVGAAAEHRVLLEFTADQWTIKKRKIIVHYD